MRTEQNECANHNIQMVPAELDLISVDTYGGDTPGSHGMDEVVAAKAMYNLIFPKLHARTCAQAAVVVPISLSLSLSLSLFLPFCPPPPPPPVLE